MELVDLTCGQCKAFCPFIATSSEGECRRQPPHPNKGYTKVHKWTDACYEIANDEFRHGESSV